MPRPRLFLQVFLAMNFGFLGALSYELHYGDELFVLHLPKGARVADLQTHVEATLGIAVERQLLSVEGEELLADEILTSQEIDLSERPDGWRDYWQELTEHEKGVIRYQVTLMANSSLPKLLWMKSELERMVSDIDHVHPLRFLSYCFEEEELKVAMRHVRRRGGWIWSGLDEEVSKSLRRSRDNHNLNDAQIDDVAARLGIDPEPLRHSVHACHGGGLISKFVELVPRSGDHSRHNF